MSEEKEKKEGKEEKKEHFSLKEAYYKLTFVAKPAGAEPPTPQPEKKKAKQEGKQE